MNGFSYGKISKMPKKYYFGRTVAFCVLGIHNRFFPDEIVHLNITAKKNFFSLWLSSTSNIPEKATSFTCSFRMIETQRKTHTQANHTNTNTHTQTKT